MTDKQKTLVLVAVIGTLLAALCVIVFMMVPSPFAAIVEQKYDLQWLGRPTESNDLININTASKTELMTLPGMTEDMAIDIIAYREEYRRFIIIWDLEKISGISKEMIETWDPYLLCE